MRELLAQLNATLNRGLPCVYCAVVATRGSTPQKAGAALLVFPDGTQAGTLGGGCVEAEVKRRVLYDLDSGTGPEVFPFQPDREKREPRGVGTGSCFRPLQRSRSASWPK